MCFWLLSSWTDAESTVPYRECSPFLSLGHSDAKEKFALLYAHFFQKGAPMGPGLTLGCPTWTEATRPIWLIEVVSFREADVLKFIASLNGTQIPLPVWSNCVRSTEDTAQHQFFSEDLMSIHPSPVLTPLHVSVSGITILSHRLGTL